MNLKKKETVFNKNKNLKKFNEAFKLLEFNNVDFSYENRKKIFSELNFTIKKKNEIVGISGETGKGKSTLLDLISGFLIQDSGKILVNNIELKDIKTDWQKKLDLSFKKLTYLM